MGKSKEPGCSSIAVGIIIVLVLLSIVGMIVNKTADFFGSFSSIGLIILGIIAIVVMLRIVDK